MNLVGKIITILILLLSVCFLMIGVMVNASHQNWKQLALDNKAKVEQFSANRKRILDDANSKNLVIEKEKVARMVRIQQLESQLQLARKDLDIAIEQRAAQQVKAEQSFIVVKESEERIAEQDKLITSLNTQLRRLTEDVAAQRAKVVAMTGLLFEKNTLLESLETMRNNLVTENTAQRKVMTAHGLTKYDNTIHIPRELEGRITAIDGSNIAVNLGLDDGLRKGHSVDIYRSGRFVGTARVFEAEDNRSAARIDRALTKVPVQVNDRVTTTWVLQDISSR